MSPHHASTSTSPAPTSNPAIESPSEELKQSRANLSVEPSRNENLPHRMSSYSQSRSRHTSTVFPLFHSSLSYALVRDFAYPPFNPMHYGPLDERPSGTSTPTGDDHGRRVSDPPPWDSSAGPWRDSSWDQQRETQPALGQQLPSTSFAHGHGHDDEEDATFPSRRISKHRKSRSYTNMEEHARGRRRSDKEKERPSNGRATRQSQSQAGLTADGMFASPGIETEPYPTYRHDLSETGRTDSPFTSSAARPVLNTEADPAHAPPFHEDEDGSFGPYSPSAEEHRPESASLDESFAGPSLALYDFVPENDNELELKEGQIIQVGYRHGQGWLVAMNLESGEQGLVPEEYVRLLRDIEGWGEVEEEEGDEESEDTERFDKGALDGVGYG